MVFSAHLPDVLLSLEGKMIVLQTIPCLECTESAMNKNYYKCEKKTNESLDGRVRHKFGRWVLSEAHLGLFFQTRESQVG